MPKRRPDIITALQPRTTSAILGLAMLGMSSCTDPSICDTGGVCDVAAESSNYTGETTFSGVQSGCCRATDDTRCPENSTYWYDIATTGHPDKAVVTAILRGPQMWSERHTLPVHLSDEEGFWQNRYLELDIADTSQCETRSERGDSYIPGVTTLFPCTNVTTSAMTWSIAIYDKAQQIGCAAWGAELSLFPECEAWEVD